MCNPPSFLRRIFCLLISCLFIFSFLFFLSKLINWKLRRESKGKWIDTTTRTPKSDFCWLIQRHNKRSPPSISPSHLWSVVNNAEPGRSRTRSIARWLVSPLFSFFFFFILFFSQKFSNYNSTPIYIFSSILFFSSPLGFWIWNINHHFSSKDSDWILYVIIFFPKIFWVFFFVVVSLVLFCFAASVSKKKWKEAESRVFDEAWKHL